MLDWTDLDERSWRRHVALRAGLGSLLQPGVRRRSTSGVEMDVHIQIRGTGPTEDIRSYVERRLCFALSRFASRLGRVSVRMTDVDGPHGGVEKSCRIQVKLVHSGQTVAIETVDASPYAAIDHATDRIGHSCGRELRRLRERDPWIRSKKP